MFFAVAVLLSLLLRRAVRLMIAHDGDGRLDRLSAGLLATFAQGFAWIFIAMSYAHTVPSLAKLGTALPASDSVASIVIGLAAQSTLANLVAALSLVLYQPFRLGDRIEVGLPNGVETGIAEEVSLVCSVPRTPDKATGRAGDPVARADDRTQRHHRQFRGSGRRAGAWRHSTGCMLRRALPGSRPCCCRCGCRG
ncbi:mechanosensitive ion channel domain-containing protein [Albidovulum sp.]|uniref:mechanosensitive ion channel domain-containing protein n=1 Tax=Albidovulum sp. TaxID=1872424 RepID=UPI0035276AE9